MNLIMTKINSITIQKEADKKLCSLEISSPTTLEVSFLSDRITAVNFYGQIVSEVKLNWQDMFTDGVQILVEGVFEDTDNGVYTIGKYDMLNGAFIEMGD